MRPTPELQVLTLARRGNNVVQIARRTRLSQDLVTMVLTRHGRQDVPHSAASASLGQRVGRFFRWVMSLEVDI